MLIFQIQCCPDWEYHMATVHGGSGIQVHCISYSSISNSATDQEFKKPFISNWSCNFRQLPATWNTPKKLYFLTLKRGKLRSSCGKEFQKLVISCRSASRTEIICVCIPIPKELTWLQRLPKQVGTLKSITLKAKDNAPGVVLEMQKSPHHRYTKCSQTEALFPSKNFTSPDLSKQASKSECATTLS